MCVRARFYLRATVVRPIVCAFREDRSDGNVTIGCEKTDKIVRGPVALKNEVHVTSKCVLVHGTTNLKLVFQDAS
jgi:hypothetical protein